MCCWNDISDVFAGLFFRVVGGGSNSFNGGVQRENSPRITNFQWANDGNVRNGNISPGWDPGRAIAVDYSSETEITSTNMFVSTGGPGPTDGFHIKLFAGEVRPRNQAVRIWERIYCSSKA